jgi:hypothetical protein
VYQELLVLLEDNNRKTMLNDYETLVNMLGNKGASQRTAQLMYTYLNKKNVSELWQMNAQKKTNKTID